MEKLEKEIKKTLDKRAITPSKMAWDKIETQLEPEVRQSRKGIFWYGLAAAAIALLISSSVFFFNRSSERSVIQVVDNEATGIKEDKELIEAVPTEVQPIVQAENLQPGPILNKPARKTLLTPMPEAAKISVEPEWSVLTEERSLIAENQMDRKVQEIVKQVINLESSDIAVTEAEVDALLFQAQKEILTEDVVIENGKVDAMALLVEIEDELDRTFRGHLFEKLKNNYFKVRLAMAERNK